MCVAASACVALAGALRNRTSPTASGSPAELLATGLHMYPVDNAALQAYLAHVHRGLPATADKLRAHRGKFEELKSGARQRLGGKAHTMLRAHAAMAAAARHPGRPQMLSDDTDDLDGSTGLVHSDPLEDPNARPENSYTIQGTSFPSKVTIEGPPGGGYQAEGAAPGPTAAAGEEDKAEAQGKPCSGPVRHMDTPLCVAKKAMAQALQAEHDVQSVDASIDAQVRKTDALDAWETNTVLISEKGF
ncbi:hypothetical protein T484DRAFT_1839855 [Baffinella frigidus]|nr:hypothetical protein T484DRAFT_1839855 [Cryptophyta sp. CCMP2293]